MKSQITSLLDKKMDRADFLKYIGVGVLAMTGIAGAMRAFGISPTTNSNTTQSYGTSAYGGIKRD